MNSLFEGASLFNRDLNWDVSKVETMSRMFHGATNFEGNISEFDTSSVTTMQDSKSFHQLQFRVI